MLVVSTATVGIIRLTGGEGRVALALQVGGMVVVQGEPLPVVLGQFPLGVKGGQPCGPRLLPGLGCWWSVTYSKSTAWRVRNQRCCLRSVMPRSTEVTQPPRRRAPSILLTLSSSRPSTGARLTTLARGILAVILNRRLSSWFNGCRAAIAAPPVCPGTRAVGWFPPPANRSPGQGRGLPDCPLAVRLRSSGMHFSMCLGQG